MPESKHRRKGQNRPRPKTVEKAQEAPRPTASSPWVPRVGGGLLAGGLVVILLGYLEPVQDLTSGFPLAPNFPLVFGFVMLSVGFAVLTRWR